MYKVASDNRQRALHHGKPADWVNGEEKLSVEDQLRQMRDGLRTIDTRILKATGNEKRRLCVQKQDMQNELVAFRAKHGLERKQPASARSLDTIFVDFAKEMLPKVQFEMILNAAKRDLERRQKPRT